MKFSIKGTPEEIMETLYNMVECTDCYDTGEVSDGQHDNTTIRKCHCHA